MVLKNLTLENALHFQCRENIFKVFQQPLRDYFIYKTKNIPSIRFTKTNSMI
jgi:hypothetical protein